MIVNIPKMKHIHGVPHILSNKELENNGNQAEFHLNGDNVGYQLLVKQGWNEQSGLGSNEDGKLYPVRVNYKHDKKGIGIKERPIIKNQKQKDERLLEESKAEKLYNKLSYEDKYSSLLPSNIYKYDSISNEEYSILSNINQEFQNTLPNPSPTVSQLRKHQKTIETLDLAKKKGIILNSGDSSTSFVKQDKILKKIIKKQRNKEKKELKNKILKEEKSRLKLLEYLKN
ncbi:hypothetical protein BCR36DRAFT_410480 [Piromyces finnis]|uniref:G-patch domain-containing protein n=1 Tax=Piromyces finnis TaxID=1754191 RepID=A0A1Y1VFP5_9FUNG|nr:hypothetical protein BCR36DRAFT_410480 [Piromyces finnis]|eukprot:ORX54669.1 hypothetical protein BCR36DRAFT_410480 [Piromyces finnis]